MLANAEDRSFIHTGHRPHGARSNIRVMIVDDSLTMRAAIARIVEAEDDMCVVAKVGSAEVALAHLETAKPDVILLDLEMPGLGGLDALPKFLAASGSSKVLVVSSLTQKGARATLEALARGAADTVPKPDSFENGEHFKEVLVHKLRALGTHYAKSHAQCNDPHPARLIRRKSPIKIIAMGASTGGIHALSTFFYALPSAADPAIIITQHLPPNFMPVFAAQISDFSKRPAVVAASGMRLAPGHIYIAPGDGHLTVRSDDTSFKIEIVKAPMPSGCCPSVDPMLQSLAECAPHETIAVILSGMGRDGAEGAEQFFNAGGAIYAQEERSSAVWGMPRAVAEKGLATLIASPEKIAHRIAADLVQTVWN